jgi:hypothetical protein
MTRQAIIENGLLSGWRGRLGRRALTRYNVH